MGLGWKIYWVGILDNISCACSIFTLLFGVIAILTICYGVGEDSLLAKKIGGFVFLPIWIIFTLGAIFVPSTKHAAAIIVAPKIINAVANNKEMQKIPESITKLANDWIIELSLKKEPVK
jgi:hypothetical protein